MSASRLAFWLIPPALTLALYGRVLAFPFYWDDVANFIWMFARPLSDIWVNAAGFPFYRPFLFTVWRAMQYLFGQTNTVAFHSLSLLLHTANAWLAGLLAMRFFSGPHSLPFSPSAGDSRWAGVAGEVVMIVFPFAAPVVPLVASQFHLLVTLFALASLLAFDEHLRTRRRGWAVAAVLLAALAPFVHESGVTVGALLVLWALIGNPQSTISNFVLPLAALALNVAYLPWWASVPKARSEDFAWVGWGSARNTTVFFLEGLTFPVQFAARALTPLLGGSDVLAVALLATAGLTLAALALRELYASWAQTALSISPQSSRSAQRILAFLRVLCVLRGKRKTQFMAARSIPAQRALAFALAYTLIGGAPSIFGLPYSYIVVSPRLLVYTAPAAAVLWAGVAIGAGVFAARLARRRADRAERLGGSQIGSDRLRVSRPGETATEVATTSRIHNPRIPASVAVTVALLAIPAAHIVRSTGLHALALRPVWQMAEAVRARPAERQLFINPTNWIAHVKATYAIGHEGVEVMAGYLTPQMMARVHTRTISPVDGVNFPLVNVQLAEHYFEAWGPPLDWETLAGRLADYDRVWLLRYGDEQLDLQEVGWVRRGAPPVASPPTAVFGDHIRLDSARVTARDDRVQVELDWRMLSPSGEDIFAHAFDCAGNVLGLADGAGLGGVYPVWLWQAGDSVRDIRHIPLSAPPADGCYFVEVGLFDPATGERTPARDAAGRALENNVVVLTPSGS